MISERYSRQSFLGSEAESSISNCVVGLVGLGGGGSHIVQQLAHIGFRNYVLYDADVVEESNLNRLIGATVADAKKSLPKIKVAQRLIRGLQPNPKIEAYQSRWQEQSIFLRRCDIIFGCVDGLAERRGLEVFTRRYLIPYIDIGLDVYQPDEKSAPVMAGQVILSLPGSACMQCLNFLSEEVLAKETLNYGAVGIRPQVVWANGSLASTAVGIAVNLLTHWTNEGLAPVYLSYTANDNQIKPHVRLGYVGEKCNHYALDKLGDPIATSI